MLKNTLFVAVAFLLLFSVACKHSIKAEALYGNWKYTKVDKPRSDDLSDTVSNADLADQTPEIRFLAKNKLVIVWGGKILSHGTFVLDGDNINYTEQLADGKTRAFPFWISKLDNKTIIFETLGKDGSRVVAVKK